MKDLPTKLANGILTETLHGPVPIKTVAELAQGVLDAAETIEGLQRRIDRMSSYMPGPALGESKSDWLELERDLNDRLRKALEAAKPLMERISHDAVSTSERNQARKWLEEMKDLFDGPS